MDHSEHLSTHFKLGELLVTSHTEIDNSPDDFEHDGVTIHVIDNLRTLCNDFLEPLRERFGPLHLNSGYRSRALNEAIPGSAKDSAHSYGCAADVHPPDGVTVTEMLEWARHNLKGYDQLIDEQKGDAPWLHVGMLRPAHEPQPRGQVMRMRTVDGKPHYTNV